MRLMIITTAAVTHICTDLIICQNMNCPNLEKSHSNANLNPSIIPHRNFEPNTNPNLIPEIGSPDFDRLQLILRGLLCSGFGNYRTVRLSYMHTFIQLLSVVSMLAWVSRLSTTMDKTHYEILKTHW